MQRSIFVSVPTFNSCTKYVAKLGHNSRPHAQLLLSFLGKYGWMISQLKVVLVRKLRGLLMFLAYFLTCYPWVFVQPGTGRRPVNWRRNYMSVL